ncbi:MAG: hypothetical protein WAO98_04115 [Alphaproteobacteria bacterium]
MQPLETYAASNSIDPFETNTKQWMSFERYKEKAKNGTYEGPEPVVEVQPKVTTPYAEVEIPADGSPALAPPTRPLAPPLMPGSNKGFDVRVGTTEDDKPPVAHITNMQAKPLVEFLERNWQNAQEVAKRHQRKSTVDGEEEVGPLDVRMSFLPSPKVTPIPGLKPDTNGGRPQSDIAAASSLRDADKQKNDYAAWIASIDAYKKRQLEALQSDRQTLSALQAAIAELGLQKELNFMPGADSTVNMQADSINGKMDIPASSPAVPVKN